MNKIALITGGSRGLGRNMALTLADRGTDIIFTYHSKKEEADEVVAEITAKGRKAATLRLDVTKAETFADFYAQVTTVLKTGFKTEKIDFLINNAGVGVYSMFPETTEDQIDLMMNMHFKAPFLLAQKALTMLNDGGAIVNISSGLARFSMPGYAAYGAMKAAMETLTRYQALELGDRKIRVNIVAPGAIETDFGGGVVRDNDHLNEMIAGQTSLGRVGLPDDIGGVVAFLCSGDAGWVNGQRIEISGGIHL